MTTPERSHNKTMIEVQRLLSRAKPEQLRRLLEDIQASGNSSAASERDAPQRRAS